MNKIKTIPAILLSDCYPNRDDYKNTLKNKLMLKRSYYRKDEVTFVEKIEWSILTKVMVVPFFLLIATPKYIVCSVIPEMVKGIKEAFKPKRVEEFKITDNSKGYYTIIEFLKDEEEFNRK